MTPAFYMRFTAGHHGAPDRIGGLPTHMPPSIPVSSATGKEMAFLGQFYSAPDRLNLGDALGIHLYQELEDSPLPIAIQVPRGAIENTAGLGVPMPGVLPFDVEWEYQEDPDTVGDDQTELAMSKAGGICYFWGVVGMGERLVLQLRQGPAGFNFGGYSAVVVQEATGQLVVRLG